MYILARCVRSWRPPVVLTLLTTSKQCGAWVTNLIQRKNKKGTWPMATSSSRLAFSLRAKLVLSYLGVALGAMLLLIIVVSLAVQNYFYSAQLDQFRANAEYTAQQIGQRGNIGPINPVGSEFYIVVDSNDHLLAISQPI